jgi:hypothetical protein
VTTVTFTSSGTWVTPTGYVSGSLTAQAWGEGGDGSSSVTNHHGGGGGGGGAFAQDYPGVVVSTVLTYTIGSGGTSTNTTITGASPSITADAGASGSGTNEGTGGPAGSNAVAFAGGPGGGGKSTGSTGTGGGGGGGGSAGAGSSGGSGGTGGSASGGAGGTAGSGSPGGAAGGAGSGTAGAAGANGTVPGSGGGGGSRDTLPSNGGSGAGGQVTLIYTLGLTETATLAGTGTLTAGGAVGVPGTVIAPQRAPGPTWLRRFGRARHQVVPGLQLQTFHGTTALTGAGTLAGYGSLPAPAVVNQWAGGYGQGTTFTAITPALQSTVVSLTPTGSVGPGSGVPTAGNWLFTIASWTQNPQIANVHIGTADDIRSYWREYPAAGSGGLVRTAVSYTPNIAGVPQYVYVAPDMEVAAMNVLVIEVAGLGPWDTVAGTDTAYTGSGTSLSLSLGAPAAASFFLGATGGNNASSGQAFTPAGWTSLVTQTQTNGVNTLADNILTAAVLSSSLSAQSVSGSAGTAEAMSGFLVGVYTNAPSPVPAGNQAWPHIVAEAGFGSGFNTPDSEVTWTDISNRLWEWDEQTGIQFELGELQSTNLTLILDNFDGALSPLNSLSPYYPYCVPGTPVRLRMALGTLGGSTCNRWYVIARNATQWAEQIDDTFRRYCTVTGADIWAALSATPPTFYRSEVYEDAPYAWWPCDDQPGTAGVLPTALLNAALGNTNTLDVMLSSLGGIAQTPESLEGYAPDTLIPPTMPVYTTGALAGWMPGDPQSAISTVDTGNPQTATPGSAAWQASGQSGSTGSYGWYLSCNDSSFPPLSSGITAEGWFQFQFQAGPTGIGETDQPSPLQQQPLCPLTLIELATGSNPVAVLQLDDNGALHLITYSGGTGTSNLIYNGSDLRSGAWFMVSMTLTQTSWTVYVNGGATAEVSGTASGMTSAWTWLIANADMGSGGGGASGQVQHCGNTAIAHLALYPYVLPYYRIMDHYWAAITGFGQLPAPTSVQVTWTPQVPTTGNQVITTFSPDGSTNGGYTATTGVAASGVAVAVVPGGITSGPSAWATGTTVQRNDESGTGYASLWLGWQAVAPLIYAYTSSKVGAEEEAAVTCGSGAAFSGGYGGSATGTGVCQVAGGNGSPPPTVPSSVGDTVGQRIERLMRAGLCSSPNRCIDQAPLQVQSPGATGGGVQAGAGIQAIQQSDDGMLFVDNCNNLTYWQRPHLQSQYSSPVWALGPVTSAGQVPYYRAAEWITDPQRVWNAITVQPLSPTGASLPLLTPQDATAVNASQDQDGAQPYQVTSYLQSVTEMQSQANWLFSVYGTPQRRAAGIRIDAAPYPQAWQLVAGINVGDVVTMQDWQIGGGGTVYTYRVTAITRRISYGSHDSDVTGSVVLTLDHEPNNYWE